MGETLKWSYIFIWIGSLLMETGDIGIFNRGTIISHELRQCVPLGDPKDM